MQITIRNTTYELTAQPKKPAPMCCEGCAVAADKTLQCSDFKGICAHSDNLDKVWKRASENSKS